MKILNMTLKKEWFDKIKSGQKKYEYREYKDYWITRLVNPYTHIKFINGYSKEAPSFIKEILSVKIVDGNKTDLEFNGKVFKIELGEFSHEGRLVRSLF
jgi:ASC-1-like (ASCH) protein